ncbi:MAG: serine/threonine protein kinase, bacterial, partial [Elusimicrobia bacterium]
MKSKAWVTDALIGLLLTGFVGAQYILGGAFLESLELKAYDARSQFRTDLEPKVDLVIVAIDDESITRLGRWPWPRTRIAEMLDKLKAAGPRVIGLDILYTEPERNPALAELEAMQARYLDLVAGRQVTQKGVQFETEFSSAAERLDTDKHLLASLTATQNVVLPMFFLETSEARGAKPPELPAALSSSTLGAQVSGSGAASDMTIEATKATYPLEPFIAAAAGVGHVNIFPDLDGVVRRETLAVRYGASYYPSYALSLVARSLGYGPNEVTIEPGRAVRVGKIEIPLDESQSMLVTFNGPERTFRYFPFYEVLEGKVPADVFKDKVVILGPSAQGVGTVYVTPVAKSLPSVEFIANVIENVMNRRFLGRPAWAFNAEAGAILVIGLFVMFGLPRLRALGGAAVTLVLMLGLGFAGFWAFKERGEWIKVVYPAFLLGAGYVVIVTRRFFTTEQGKERVEASQIDDFKLMGLSYQGKGDLDLAFAKFRLVPVDVWDDVFKDTLYNLGLDFERKRQYAKAVQVYKHIESAGAPFKDTVEKVKTLSAAAEGAVFGGVGKQSKEGTVIVTGGATKATLGRYEIEKELGRGAMGIVYLGKDPKIIGGRGQRGQGALLPRGRVGRHAQPPRHRARLRRGRGERRLLHRDGALERRGPGQIRPQGDPPGPRDGHGLRRAGGGSPRLRPPAGHRPPRHQAGQHHAPQGRFPARHGLRHRAHPGLLEDGHRHRDGHAFLHEPRADLGQEGGRPLGPLQPGRHALRAPDRREAVEGRRGRHRHPAVPDRQRPRAQHPRGEPRPGAGRQAGHREGLGEKGRRALRAGQRLRQGHPGGAGR